MNILITGAKGFIGRNLTAALECVRDGKDKTRNLTRDIQIFQIDSDFDPAMLERCCSAADFVVHLAGVNRPREQKEFMEGNRDFTASLLHLLRKHGRKAPVLLASSIQAAHDTPYGISKRAAEELVFAYGRECGVPVYVYRLPNVFGKWCRPNYNSVVATFCYNIANGLPIVVNDRATELELLYIDDLVDTIIDAISGRVTRCVWENARPVPDESGAYCLATVTHKVTLGKIDELLSRFKTKPDVFLLPEIPKNSFGWKLYATYLSYLPESSVNLTFDGKRDARGSFTELMKTVRSGQISVNVAKPGVKKGEHWHNSKCECFIVLSGHGIIRERKLGESEIISRMVSGEKPEAVFMLPGYTHNIENLSDTEDLVTLIWANEVFDPLHPDTYRENV